MNKYWDENYKISLIKLKKKFEEIKIEYNKEDI